MADKKMTRKEALELMLDATREGFESPEMQEAREVVAKIIASIDKQASKPKGKTSSRVQNEQYAIVFINKLDGINEPVSAKWISENIRGVMSVSRAVWVAKIAEEWGAIQKISVKNRTLYEKVADWDGAIPEDAGRTV